MIVLLLADWMNYKFEKLIINSSLLAFSLILICFKVSSFILPSTNDFKSSKLYKGSFSSIFSFFSSIFSFFSYSCLIFYYYFYAFFSNNFYFSFSFSCFSKANCSSRCFYSSFFFLFSSYSCNYSCSLELIFFFPFFSLED